MNKFQRIIAALALLGISAGLEARWYDPQVGRWLSEDPVRQEGDENLYRYASNSPTRLIDPSGLKDGVPYKIDLETKELEYKVVSGFGLTSVLVSPLPFQLKLTDCEGDPIGGAKVWEDVFFGFTNKKLGAYPGGVGLSSEITSPGGIFHDRYAFQFISFDPTDFRVGIRQVYHAEKNGVTRSGEHLPTFTYFSMDLDFPVFLNK